MIISNVPLTVWATELETGSSVVEPVDDIDSTDMLSDNANIPVIISERMVVYTDDTATEVGDGTQEKPYKDFEMALENVADGGTIIIGEGGAYVGVDGTNDLTPLVIDKPITITSEKGADLSLRRAGIILGADVTFENVAIALANREKNAIFANGHTLTLTNVTQLAGTREVHLFAGGVAGSTAEKGSHGKIIINGTAGQFGNIYAGSMNEASDLPSTVIINGTNSMSIGDIYACGAQTGVYDANDFFGGSEPESPVASEVSYPVNGVVTLELSDTNIEKIYGLASSTNKANVIFSTTYANDYIEFYELGTLEIKSGRLIPKVLNEDVNIGINSGACLDLSAVMTNNRFSVMDFVGGGTLRLGKNDTLTIKGNISGATAFEVIDGKVLNGSGIAEEKHGYMDVSAATGEGTFTFEPYATQNGMILEKIDGVWTTVMPTELNEVSVDIAGNITNYTDIESAWEAVCENKTSVTATMTLLRHVELTENKQLTLTNDNVDLTIDLNGYMLSGNGQGTDRENGLIYVGAGKLTVLDSCDGSYGIYDENMTDGCAIYVAGGNLNVRSGNIISDSVGIRVSGGKVQLSGGTITGIEVSENANLTVGDLLASGYGYKTDTGWIANTRVKSIVEEVEVAICELPEEKHEPKLSVCPTAEGEYHLTLSGVDADSAGRGVSLAIWGNVNGQNDLRWYNAIKDSDGSWITDVSIANHKESGLYNVWIYAENLAGERVCVLKTAFLHNESVSIREIEIKNINAATGTFDVFIIGVSSSCGVDSVQIPVWSEADQSDLRWYTAWKQTDGNYATQVNLKNHNYNYGEYNVHAYVTSATQTKTFVGAKRVKVNAPKAKVQAELATNEKTVSLSASNVGLSGGVQNVYFAVWSENGGQDDLVWYQASRKAGAVWEKEISITTHKTVGIYQVHLYGEKSNGERVFLGNTTFDVNGVKAESIKVKNVFGANGTFDIFVNGITSPSGVKSIKMAVWNKEDKSDLYWYTAWKQNDGSYAVQVNIRNHGYRYGKYNIHANLTAINEIEQYIGGTTATIYPPSVNIKAEVSADENNCKLIADNVKMAGGVNKVYFAVWSEANGQDDLVWNIAEHVSGNLWRKEISIATYKTAGTYQVHMYGENAVGEKVLLGYTTFFVKGASVQSIEVKNVLPQNGTFDVFISGIEAPSGVVKVQVPVWSEPDQSDIYWYTAWKLYDGSYATQINIKNHNRNYGKYTIHTYLTSGNGVRRFAGKTSIDMKKSENLSLSVDYPSEIKCGEEVTFTMNADGGSGNYKYRIAALMTYEGNDLVNVYDISYGSNGTYKKDNKFSFTFYASGTYYIRFSVMDMTTFQTKMTGLYEYPIVIRDENHPSVEQIISTVTAQCEAECTTDFEKALWLHDWIIDNADYDYSYSYCSAEGVLARGRGTCESYHGAYVLLLNRVGIDTGRITGNGHVWTAVKLDGKWYQVDTTWDDMGVNYKDTYYEHLYFGLTDYIIGLSHTDHTEAVVGYESSSLENNYFIKTGEIQQWSKSFEDTIREYLADDEMEFTIPVTDSMPDNCKNVIYNLVAYQLEQEDWDNIELSVKYDNEKLVCRGVKK